MNECIFFDISEAQDVPVPVPVSVSVSLVVEMCKVWNGGCATGAKCSQKGGKVSCTCPNGHSGDGFTCQPIDPCVSGDNGGCHEHATCTMIAPVRLNWELFSKVWTSNILATVA